MQTEWWRHLLRFVYSIAACKKVSCHELAIASMQRVLREGNLLAFRKWKLESVRDWCNGKDIWSAYFRYDSDFSKCEVFSPGTMLHRRCSSNSLKRYVDANSCLWCHSFVTFVNLKLYFYSIKITLGTGKLINIDKLTFNEAN